MKIVLINLPSPWLISDRDVPPLGILSIAAYLRQRHEVQFCDLAGLPEEHWHIPDAYWYGISTTTPQYPYALKVIEKLRARQDCKIILGGIHPTVLPEQVLKDAQVDHVIVGEGEQVLDEILNGIKFSPIIKARQIEDISSLPFPAIDMVDAYDYLKIGTNAYVSGAKREAYIQTARGCPYNCAFCCQAKMWRGKVRFRSVERVLTEMVSYLTTYGVEQFYLNDDTFVIKEDRVRLFCRAFKSLLKDWKFAWHCLNRVDRTNPSILKEMYLAGCRAMTFGIESGSQTILANMAKGVEVAQATKAITQAKEAGIKVRCQMIVGFPGETDQTIEETAQFIKKTPADTWGIHAFVPFPGCSVWDNPEKFNFNVDLSSVDFGDFHTIGRPGEWHAIIHPQEDKVRNWISYLLGIAKEKNIFNLIK